MSRFLIAALLAVLYAPEAKALTLGQAAIIAQTAKKSAFNSIEMVQAPKAATAPQWQRAKREIARDMVALQGCINDVALCADAAQIAWRTLVLALQNQDRSTQIQTVNVFFNRFAYHQDREIYGVSDHWAGPVAFMQHGGDCEDYAIAKYTTLLFLGMADREMRIMAVTDRTRGNQGHAVLAIANNMILDNLDEAAYNSSIAQTHYTPRYAVNQAGVYTYSTHARIMTTSLGR